MREHCTFGHTSGTRGINNGGDVVRIDTIRRPPKLTGILVSRLSSHLIQGVELHHSDLTYGWIESHQILDRQALWRSQNLVQDLCRGYENHGRLAIAQQSFDLQRRMGGIDRNR